MNKLSQILVTVVGLTGLFWGLSTSKAIADEKPKCYLIEASGKLVDLSSLCDASTSKPQPTATVSASVDVEQPSTRPNQTGSIPLVFTGSSANWSSDREFAPVVFASSTPVAYINTPSSSTAYTSPSFLVRRFKQSGSITSDPLTQLQPILDLLAENNTFVIITRYR